MTALTSSGGMFQQTAALLAVATTGASQKRLEDRLPTETNGGQDMAMPEKNDCISLLPTALQDVLLMLTMTSAGNFAKCLAPLPAQGLR